MRLFIGIKIPPEISDHLTAHIGSARGTLLLRWVADQARHITLYFLGSVSESKLLDIQSIMRKVASQCPIMNVHLESGGVFPHARSPRVFWTGIQGDINRLAQLADLLAHELVAIGFPVEKREFKPHLTLGRGDKNEKMDFRRVSDQFCTLFKTYKSPVFTVHDFHLIQSFLGSSGSRYETLKTFSLENH